MSIFIKTYIDEPLLIHILVSSCLWMLSQVHSISFLLPLRDDRFLGFSVSIYTRWPNQQSCLSLIFSNSDLIPSYHFKFEYISQNPGLYNSFTAYIMLLIYDSVSSLPLVMTPIYFRLLIRFIGCPSILILTSWSSFVWRIISFFSIFISIPYSFRIFCHIFIDFSFSLEAANIRSSVY